ncbi:hypothetical protein BH09BAC3_BH09BAC3_38240 [soil metagenome]
MRENAGFHKSGIRFLGEMLGIFRGIVFHSSVTDYREHEF